MVIFAKFMRRYSVSRARPSGRARILSLFIKMCFACIKNGNGVFSAEIYTE